MMKKGICFIMRTFILETRIKTKANTSRIGIQSITMAKTICRIQHTEKNRSRKKWRQRWKNAVQINEQCCIQ